MDRVETSVTRTDSPGVSLLMGVQSAIVVESWTRRGAEAARQAHNLEVVGSNPAAATNIKKGTLQSVPFFIYQSPGRDPDPEQSNWEILNLRLSRYSSSTLVRRLLIAMVPNLLSCKLLMVIVAA